MLQRCYSRVIEASQNGRPQGRQLTRMPVEQSTVEMSVVPYLRMRISLRCAGRLIDFKHLCAQRCFFAC